MATRKRAVILSDDDYALIQKMIDRERQGLYVPRHRPPVEHSFVDGVDHQAPECYIAYVPAGGIPELVSSLGTVGAGGDIPGSAFCAIYRLVGDSLRPTGFSKKVYNVSKNSIEQGWVVVQRDKYGNWVTSQSSATIPVEIIENPDGVTGTGSLSTVSAVYRTSHPTGISVIAVDEGYNQIAAPFTCYADELVNVHWTGSVVRVTRNGPKWQIVTTGGNYWENAVLWGSITSAPGAALGELFPDGPVVPIHSKYSLPVYTITEVMFDQEQQRFISVAPGCISTEEYV